MYWILIRYLIINGNAVNLQKSIKLLAVDLNNDDKVNVTDISLFNKISGAVKNDVKYNKICDFDRNDKINLTDKSQMQANFYKTSITTIEDAANYVAG